MDSKIEVKYNDFTEDMWQEVYRLASGKLGSRVSYNECAKCIKEEFDKKYFPSWHCVVGKSFGSSIEHEDHHSIYFFFNSVSILLWKAGYQS